MDLLPLSIGKFLTLYSRLIFPFTFFREEIAKQQERLRYQKLHAQGKTDQAKADLARLAIIRKEREEAARKRQEEKEGIHKTKQPVLS